MQREALISVQFSRGRAGDGDCGVGCTTVCPQEQSALTRLAEASPQIRGSEEQMPASSAGHSPEIRYFLQQIFFFKYGLGSRDFKTIVSDKKLRDKNPVQTITCDGKTYHQKKMSQEVEF